MIKKISSLKIKLKVLITTIFFFLLIIFSIFFDDKIYFYITENKDVLGNRFQFGDWIYVLNAAICHQEGINVLGNNICDPKGRLIYQYPTTLLYLPFVNNLYSLYLYAIPALQIFFIIFFLNKTYSKTNIENLVKIFLILFSTSIILGFERGNPELLIFCLIILISYQKNPYIVQILIYIATIIKFYPLVSICILYFKKIDKKLIFSLILFFLCVVVFLVYQKDIIEIIIDYGHSLRPQTVERVGIIIFGYNVIPDLVKTTLLHLNISNVEIYYSIAFFLGILINLVCLLAILKNKIFFPKINLDIFEDKLFFYSALILVFLYYMTMSYSYREIYLIGLIPFLIKQKNKSNKICFILEKTILVKLIGMTFLWLIQVAFFENSVYIKGLNILLKGILDNIIIIFLSVFLMKMIITDFKIKFLK